MLGAALEVKFDGLVEQLNEQLPEVQRGCGGLKESVRGCSWEGMLASSYKDGLAHTFSVGKGFGFCVRDSFILFFFFTVFGFFCFDLPVDCSPVPCLLRLS